MRKEKKFHFIYKTTNNLSGRYYYGLHSTDNLEDGYLGSGRRLRYSLNKYGKENHIREILEFCKTRKELKSREEEIVNLQEIAKKDCMNLMIGGHMGNVNTRTEETRKKMSASKKGHTVSEETRKKISESSKGKIISEETRKKMSKAHSGLKNGMFGKSHTKEARKKMRISSKNRRSD